MHAKYEVSISYGSKIIAKVKIDNRHWQTDRQDKNNTMYATINFTVSWNLTEIAIFWPFLGTFLFITLKLFMLEEKQNCHMKVHFISFSMVYIRAPDNFWVQRVFTHWFLTQCWFSKYQWYFHPYIFSQCWKGTTLLFWCKLCLFFIPLWCAINIYIDRVVLYSKHVFVKQHYAK